MIIEKCWIATWSRRPPPRPLTKFYVVELSCLCLTFIAFIFYELKKNDLLNVAQQCTYIFQNNRVLRTWKHNFTHVCFLQNWIVWPWTFCWWVLHCVHCLSDHSNVDINKMHLITEYCFFYSTKIVVYTFVFYRVSRRVFYKRLHIIANSRNLF